MSFLNYEKNLRIFKRCCKATKWLDGDIIYLDELTRLEKVGDRISEMDIELWRKVEIFTNYIRMTREKECTRRILKTYCF